MSSTAFVMLRNLTSGSPEPPEAILQRAATQLGGLAQKAIVEVPILPGYSRPSRCVGVIVTPADLATGQHVTQNYATPCS